MGCESWRWDASHGDGMRVVEMGCESRRCDAMPDMEM